MNTPLSLDASVLQIIERDFQGLFSGELGLSSIKGGQSAADEALATLDIKGYAGRRSQVLPKSHRGASGLSPYIRHNLLTLGPPGFIRTSQKPLPSKFRLAAQLWRARIYEVDRFGLSTLLAMLTPPTRQLLPCPNSLSL